MMEKTTISKQVGVVLVTLAIILGFTGPAGSASKSGEETKSRGGQTIRFEPSLVTKKKFSSHTQKPRVSSAQEEKLLKAGYGMIGKMEVEHREKECYEGKKCKTLYRGKDQPTTALLKEAARQGADLVVMEKDNLSYSAAISKRGKCIQKIKTCGDVWVPRRDSSGMMVMDSMYVCSKKCIDWEMLRGETHITRSSAVLWRKHPELAHAQLREGLSSTGWSLPAAAREGSLIKTKMLLSMDADPNQKNEQGETPLHLAARSGHTGIAELFLAKGVNVNTKDKGGGTPLHGATLEMAKLLIAKDADVNAKSKGGTTALHNAAFRGRVAVVKLLIESGADINARTKKDYTPLMSAAEGNRIEVVKLLLKSGADPTVENRYDSEDKWCCNALDIALYSKHTAVAQELEKWRAKGTERREAAVRRKEEEAAAKKRAEKLFETPPEQQALLDAAGAGRLAAVRKMLDAGVAADGKVGYDKPIPLYAASEAGHLEVVKLLLQRGADPNRKTHTGIMHFPLVVAAEKGHTEVVRALLDKGADITLADRWTALHNAATYGHADIVRLLLSRGADPKRLNDYGRTPLFGAASGGHTEIVELLIAKGLDVNRKDKDGGTPLQGAAYNGHTEIAELLIAKGADVNTKNKYGYTPLHRAAMNGHMAMARLLIAKGADINPKASRGKYRGWTPLRLAQEWRRKDMVNLLKQHGAKK